MRNTTAGIMAGRTVVVTGSSGGIGKATALRLAQMGAIMAVTGRNETRTRQAANEVRSATGAVVRAFTADLSSQAEVRKLAAALLDTFPRIDVLVNNAGGYWNTRHITSDGLERTFAINHLAPFLLTKLLLDRLKASPEGRVVTVSSNAQRMGRIDFEDLQGEEDYSGARAYNQSKLANVLFTHELARKLAHSSVTANALHPGVVRTSFGAGDPGRAQRLFVPLARPFMRTPDQGAATSVLLASSPDLKGVQGTFFSNGKPRRSSKLSYDAAIAAQLWQTSNALVRLPGR
ncbi:SDR family oxidoreductase [Pedococcus sp. 5OH_020]|uniref:SDR family oxidoreductase n=1 Tax=Pedococcus sp. 5OH_020 TaxID=2989814 RepID=UPI0022E9ED4B|nr:SDR family oxidoreductase [Pedococcus sp. 5OH_020]